MGLRDVFRLPHPIDSETGLLHGHRRAHAHMTPTRYKIALAIGGHGVVPYNWHGAEATFDDVENAVKAWLTENKWLTIEFAEAGRRGTLTFRTEFVTDYIVWWN